MLHELSSNSSSCSLYRSLLTSIGVLQSLVIPSALQPPPQLDPLFCLVFMTRAYLFLPMPASLQNKAMQARHIMIKTCIFHVQTMTVFLTQVCMLLRQLTGGSLFGGKSCNSDVEASCCSADCDELTMYGVKSFFSVRYSVFCLQQL